MDQSLIVLTTFLGGEILVGKCGPDMSSPPPAPVGGGVVRRDPAVGFEVGKF